MNTNRFALLLVGLVLISSGAPGGESIVRKSEGIDLPAPSAVSSVPWLDLDWRNKMPKGTYPIGWQSNRVVPFTLEPAPTVQTSIHLPQRDDG